MSRPAPVLSWRSASQKRRISGDLQRVEAILGSAAAAHPGLLAEACATTLNAGGKRLRPLLVLLCARGRASADDAVLQAAAAVELLHMATLVHDDVLDRAVLRRGQPTIAHRFGPEVAVSVGNYLLARAFKAIVTTGDGPAVALLSSVSRGLSEGEIMQMREAYRVDLGVDDYLRRCRCKTAALFAASCRLGALLTGCSERSQAALDAYGDALGIAFQIFDDVLDLRGDESHTGKRLGVDLRDGTITLPLIFALEADRDLGPRLAQRPSDDTEIDTLIAEIEASGALERARLVAVGYVAEAREHLQGCEDDVETGLLDELAGSVVDRFN